MNCSYNRGMLKFVRLFYLLCAIALLPMHGNAMGFSHVRTQVRTACAAAPAACDQQGNCGTSLPGHGHPGHAHMGGDCCQVHLGALPSTPAAFIPAMDTPVTAYHVVQRSPTHAPPERPPQSLIASV